MAAAAMAPTAALLPASPTPARTVERADRRAATAATMIGHLKTHGRWFQGDDGRTVLLRGVNVGGDSKFPAAPDERTFLPTDFSQHATVSFVGRPFPLSEAPTHFARLRHWGFNCIRMLTTWEAVEHAGPAQYDEAYLDYLTELCRIAGEYGHYLFIDFHQDAWSRMSGGDGAPCWVYEKLGIDYSALAEADAAIVMQYHYDFSDPRKVQEDRYPTMCWSQNYRYAGNAVPWTLFFAGRTFTPDFLIDGVNVQDYLQGHYLGAMMAVAQRLKDMPHVLGFDTLNEPSAGWIGVRMSDRRDQTTRAGPALPGIAWSPVEALYSSYGHSIDLPLMELQLLRGSYVPGPMKTLNRAKRSIWLPGRRDPFLEAGAYELTDDPAKPFRVLKEDFFRVQADGQPVRLNRDVYFPFFNRVADAVHVIRADWMIFAEREPMTFAKPASSRDVPYPAGYVNATHWYDAATLGSKAFHWPFTVDLINKRLVFGTRGISAMYRRQLRSIALGSEHVGPSGCPTLLGEFGIPYDLSNGAAYREWAAGDRSDRPWASHIMALDLMYNAMDHLLIHGTQWNYTALNRNDALIGDGWNQEDLSIYSADQATSATDPWSGGRALRGIVRPRPLVIQGEVLELRFLRNLGTFRCKIRTPATLAEGPPEAIGTVFYIPRLQFPHGFDVAVSGDACAVVLQNEEAQRLVVSASLPNNIFVVTVTSRKPGPKAITARIRSWL